MYITPDEFISSLLVKKENKEKFLSFDEEYQQSLIYGACIYLDLAYQNELKGAKNPENEFQFPREGEENVPKGVKSSVIMIIQMMMDGVDFLGSSISKEQEIKSFQAGSVKVEFEQQDSTILINSPPAIINSMMEPYLCSLNNNDFKVVSYL